ncbi:MULTISPECIES: translocation/assembly module TamB domain-containing protein [unclassified Treponema]|uniref:translocation/assembly module TamB domain-containing protein n=1 Tax=unclassified Treponema TaxID=2638727 RepID=UPI0020A4DB1F|nr:MULTISPECIES: translocation/assembly module TamB domain-containing protein [unclassified Treponema]UTC66364.1 hypothetical protein E4O06_10350 [Treponema sp. OMZ 789]UTC69094.1 hypothetical protein E4O01_10495 [Treponema sp. OMZ 790]UTC71806.1 hypothetical protein E4O02_10585 [Treponema sp. OMZ 791]
MENIKKRRIIEIIVFLAIVASSLIVFRPAAKALEGQLVYVRDNLIKTLEDQFEIKITYASMSPSFFDRIKIRDVNIYNALTQKKIAHFSLLYVDYRLYSLITKDFTSVLASLGVYDGIIDFDIEENKNILKKIDTKKTGNALIEENPNNFDNADLEITSSADIIRIIEENLKKVKDVKPIKIELKNLALNYSNKTSTTDLYTSNGVFTLNSGKIDFDINSNFRYNNFVRPAFKGFSTLININGSFYPNTVSASSIINFSDIKIGNIYVKKFSVFASYLDKIASITTLQDIQPVDVKGVWNTVENTGSINLECKDLKPLLVVSPSQGEGILNELKDAAFTGNFNLSFSTFDKLLWDTAFSIKLPKFQIGGSKIEKSVLSFKAEGDENLIKLQNLRLNSPDINLSAQGSYKIKEISPNFNLNISKFKLASGESMAMQLNVFSKQNKIFSNISRIQMGKAELENISCTLEKKTGKTDIYISGKDGKGSFSLDGTWNHPKEKTLQNGPGYLEFHGTVDSISVENIYNGAVSFSGLKRPAQNFVEDFISPVQMTSEFYISSDFKHFSYNIIQTVLASNSKNGFYTLFSVQGNESSFNVSNIDILFNKINLKGNINSSFGNEGLIFDSLLTLNDISYKVSGLLDDEIISIYGDYGLNVNVIKDMQNGLKGTIQVKELPVPFINSIFSADTAVEYKNKNNWELNCNYIKLEYLEPDITKTDESLEFYAEGYAKPKEAFFHNVKAGIKNKQLEGTAAFNLLPALDKNINQYGVNLSLSDKNKKESFILNSLLALSDKIYFDGTCKIKDISLNRFLKKQRPENTVDVEFIFLGNEDSLSLKADLKNISFNLNGQNIEGKAAAFVDNNKMSLLDSSFKWGGHKLDNIEASIIPSEQKGSLGFLYEFEPRKPNNKEKIETKAALSFDFTSTADKKNIDNQNIIEKTLNLMSHFNIDMKISDWILAGKRGESDIKASLVKEPNIIALYAGSNDEIYGFKTDYGIVSLHIDESFPFHLNIDGMLTGNDINLAVTNIGIDLAKVINIIPNNDIITFSAGRVYGDLQISGTQKDPLFYGTLKGEKLFCTSPNYSPDTYGPAEVPIEFSGTLISVPYTVLHGKIGSIWGEAKSEFIGWIPYYTTVDCGVLENSQALIRTKNIAFHADGRAEGKIRLEINPELITLEGDAYFNKGYFSVPFAELQKHSENASKNKSSISFYMNLNLNLGKKSEFRYPSTEFPFLRALAYTESEPFNLNLDTGAGKFEMSGSAKIRTGEIFYIKRNFYIKEGELKILNTPFQQIEPIISVRAEIKDKLPDGQPLTINLTAKEQYLDIERFRPVITTSPPMAMSDSDTMNLMGQVALGDLKNGNVLKETLLNASDILAKMGIMRRIEQEARDFLHVDVFSARSLLIQNVVLENLFKTSKDKPLTIGNYFDNTSVYIGKYFGSAIYADAMLHLSYYDPLSTKTDFTRKPVYGNLLFQPEIGFEMNTPFFLLRWHIAPSRPDSLFVSDTGLTLSWKFSY